MTPDMLCLHCQQSYPATQEFFHPDKRKPFGLRRICKACQNTANKKYRKRPKAIKTRREYHALSRVKAKRAIYREKWSEKNPGYQTLQTREWRAKNPEKSRAHRKVGNEIKRGRMKQQSCGQCGKPKTQAHHDDYSKPLDVRWLCATCHGIEHRNPIADAIEKP